MGTTSRLQREQRGLRLVSEVWQQAAPAGTARGGETATTSEAREYRSEDKGTEAMTDILNRVHIVSAEPVNAVRQYAGLLLEPDAVVVNVEAGMVLFVYVEREQPDETEREIA